MSLDILASVDPTLFRVAAQALIDQSDALRTSFIEVDGERAQVIADSVPVSFTVRDLSGAAHTDESRGRAVEAWSQTPFDLGVAPLIDHLLIRIAPDHWTWHVRCHHLVIDAAGAAVGIGAILRAYVTLAAGGSPDLAHLGSYRDHLAADAEYLASPQYARDLAHWTARHAEPEAPLFRAGEGMPVNGAPHRRSLARNEYDALIGACREEGVQPFHAFIATLGAIAVRLFGRTSISLGLATHNRTNDRERNTVGLLAGTVAFPLDVDPYETLAELARRTSLRLRRDYRHARLPLHHLGAALHRDGPLYDVALSFYPAASDIEIGGAVVRVKSGFFAGLDTEPAAIHVRDPEGGLPLGIDLTHRPDLVRSEDVVATHDAFVRLLGQWPRVRTTPLTDLAI